MNKAILIPIKPIWCAKIMNGDKTIEVRKNKALYKATMKLIEEQGYVTFFMYCTKIKKHFRRLGGQDLDGKVLAKYTVRKAEHFEFDTCSRDICGYWLDNGQVFNIKKTCLTSEEMFAYIGGKDAYAYHIEDLVIFDKPKELSEFKHYQDERIKVMGSPYNMSFFGSVNYHYEKKSVLKPLTKAPQNFVFVESEE